MAKIAIIRRIARIEAGLFGGHEPVRDGINEIRIDVGAGHRVYYAHVGRRVILLTCGGDKKSQRRDIERAIQLLKNWEK